MAMEEQPPEQERAREDWLASPEGRRFIMLQGEGLLCHCLEELKTPQEIEQGMCYPCWLLALEAEEKAEIAARGFLCKCGKELTTPLEQEHGICQGCVTAYAKEHPLPDGPATEGPEEPPF
jgi:hypothetical protein